MKTMNTTVKGIAIGVLMATSIGVASAATLITEWGYDNRLGFTAWTQFPAPSGNAGDVTPSDDFTILDATLLDPALVVPGTLSWGNPFPAGGSQSSLESSQTASSDPTATPPRPNLVTGISDFGAEVAGVTLTHNNFPISAPSLRSATLLDVIYLTPLLPNPEATLPPIGVNFEIEFLETPNAGNSAGICADGGSPGSGVNVNGCADIFVVTGPAEFIGDGFLTISTLDILGTDIMGYNYVFKIRADGLGPLSDEACAAVGQADGCQGWLTIEGQSNVLEPFFSVRADLVPVPAPATMLLFGAGLLALGATVRRRRS